MLGRDRSESSNLLVRNELGNWIHQPLSLSKMCACHSVNRSSPVTHMQTNSLTPLHLLHSLLTSLWSSSTNLIAATRFFLQTLFVQLAPSVFSRADSLTRIIYWPEPFQCTGREPRLAHCELRMNGQIYGHRYGCDWEGKNFVFLHCGKENLDEGEMPQKKNLGTADQSK